MSVPRGLLLAVLLLAGCSSEQDEDGTRDGDAAQTEQAIDAGESPAEHASIEIHATATEFAFDPDHWTVHAGQDVVLELTNDGNVEHDWVVLEPGTEISSTGEFAHDMVVWEIEAEAGETVTGTFTAPEPGTYQVVCTIRGLRATHYVAGMEGTLEVVE